MNTKTIAVVLLLGVMTATVGRAEDQKPFKNEKEKASYAIGMSYGSVFKRMDVDVDYDSLLEGIKDARSGGPTRLTEQEMRQVLTKFSQELMAKQREKQRELGEKNRKEGEEFLAANKGKPGVVTLTNGLQYVVLAEGNGPSPKPGDIVSVNYRGMLIDGTVFEESPTNKPAMFAADRGIIRGWTEALTRMKAGSKWKLFIPSDLAYQRLAPMPR
jgi:FKBP-type peptidyl-prolyl cis-trans isomerase FklB